ncbi:dihydroorotate dehydrogenase [Thermoanaerobacterium thermosaccharolyticum]
MSLMTLKSNLEFKNPVFVASGTFGFGKEYSQYVDLNKLGAIMVKGLTLNPKEGNPPPRIYETPSGILNSVGLQNPGVDGFLRDELPFLKKFDTKVIVNIAGETIEEFVTMAQKLDIDGVHALELNVSCPNVKEGGMAFGVNPNSIYEITKRVKGVTSKIVIVKLTPNVADIKIYAKAAEDGGADAVSLINTITGMAVDINSRKPIFKNIFAGLSGPAVKPIALKYVYEAKKAVSIPVIGMGGISSAEDAIEFMIVGATAVAIGTYNFINPTCTMDILEDIKKYMNKNNVSDINQIINSINV